MVVACAVCGAVTDEQRGAFLGTTILLSLLPLGLLGFIGWVVYRQLRPAGRSNGFQRLTERKGADTSSATTSPKRPATAPPT